MAGGREPIKRANVIGAGPNGLAAAVTLAQAGLAVEVFDAEAQPGGAARTMELTLPGFHHDFGSSVYPMGAGSPFFRTLPLAGSASSGFMAMPAQRIRSTTGPPSRWSAPRKTRRAS